MTTIPRPETIVPTSIGQESGSPNSAHAHTNVTDGLKNSTLDTRAGDERRKHTQYRP
jgi:hypothetical protein